MRSNRTRKHNKKYNGGLNTPIQHDSSSLREDSLRKPTLFKSSLNFTNKWDKRVDYLELMKSYLASQNEIIKDLQKKINEIPANMKKKTGGDHYYEILATIRNMTMLTNKDYFQNYVKTIPTTEEKALKNLRSIFRDQINFLSLKSKIDAELSKINIENKSQKGNVNNIQNINTLRKIDNKINFETASRIVETMRKQGLKFTKKNMKKQITQNVRDEVV